jgi:hypothetical protein
MADETGGVLVHLTVSEPLPLDVPAGNSVAVTARASCPEGRDRTGVTITVTAPDGQATMHAFAMHADGVSETTAIALAAPPCLGVHVFRFTLPAHEIAGTHYAQAVLDVPVRVTPQATSLAAWDVPSPVVAGTRFVIKAGAKSAANATLAGRAIEVRDDAGDVAGRGVLSDAPLPGTGALYWTDIHLQAPRIEGVATWSARFEASELDLPHDGAKTSFSVAVVRPPEHVLSVKVIEQATAAPIPDVELRLGAYRGTTGASGLAEIALPKGRYELRVWKVGFEAPPRPVEVGADAFVEIEALAVPEEDPDARWRM